MITGSFTEAKQYVVQTNPRVVERCISMTTDPGDLVLDPTCGSGTTAYVAEQWGRRWITCDTSRVAVTLAKQRLMTAVFDYYELAHPEEGVSSGFRYKTVPHIMLKSIANNPEIKEGMTRERIDAAIKKYADQETLYDQPYIDKKKLRVTGPFTVEAVPAPAVKPLDEVKPDDEPPADDSIARLGETRRQRDWRDELLKTGIRSKGGQRIEFSRVEPLAGTRWLHADAEIVASDSWLVASEKTSHKPSHSTLRVVISFGPEHAPLEQRQVALAIEEAQSLVPKPKIIVFAAFQFDPEAAKDIDETQWPGVTLLKAQMNADLLTEDLKKKRVANESFWLIGQPDVVVTRGLWLVDSAGKPVRKINGGEKLARASGVAESDGISSGNLSCDQEISEGGKLRSSKPDEASSGMSAEQHSGGADAQHKGRIPSVHQPGEGVPSGTGNTDYANTASRLSDAKAAYSVTEHGYGGGQAAHGALQVTSHEPLATKHFYQVEVLGFDYYNTRTGNIESGGADKIAMWMLDIDYDGRSLFPRQVFFPMASDKDGWARLAKSLKAEIDEERVEAYKGTVSLPFEAREHHRVAVKIIDDRGIESLKIIEVDR
jgi:DNA modification methylase